MFNNFWTANPICFKKCRKAEICLVWILRGSVAYVITSSHFDSIDWSEETDVFRPSEPNRNDCWRLAPPPSPDWFKLSHIQPINIGFGLLNHCLACFFGNGSKVKVKCRACMKTNTITHLHESTLKKPRKTQHFGIKQTKNKNEKAVHIR